MATEFELTFSTTATSELGNFKLVQLPPEICTLVEDSWGSGKRFEIKGDPTQEAVFCTTNASYSMRTVGLSNAILVLDTLLAGLEFGESSLDLDDEENLATPKREVSLDDVRSQIQASEDELLRGLKERRILNLNGSIVYYVPIASEYLLTILETILNLLVSLGLDYKEATISQMCDDMADQHDIPQSISTQVLGWFGQLKDGKWSMDAPEVVRTIGLEILKPSQRQPMDKGIFITTWKSRVGDTFESFVDMKLLSGYVLSSTTSMSDDEMLLYYPRSSLPVDPPSRFTELFSVRPRWRQEDISPFLEDIAYARAITDNDGISYTSRAQYNS
ncbi:hypothetical protein DL96DRAFT_1593118 [Flagelloscypha sp. PMI_526]|nr:hypothetical protein DL96DRAFT_1593118 [Flagelloscypha sp. PMI_526]